MSAEYSILKVLVYFDIFDYPVTINEIWQFMDHRVDETELEDTLSQLLKKGVAWKNENFYSLRDDPSLVRRRLKGNEKAMLLLKKGRSIGRFLSGFPFVRAVGITGSVSKYYADEQADIDYLIIAAKNRLWIARTFLHLYKKIPILKNRNRYYCMNYFIDESQLVIEEKNIYTATELITMIPVSGNHYFDQFYHVNNWAFRHFPNCRNVGALAGASSGKHLLKIIIEFLLNNRLGDWLDDVFFKWTASRWNQKEKQQRLNTKGERMGLRTSKHCSKPNPEHFHDRFMEKYGERLQDYRKNWPAE